MTFMNKFLYIIVLLFFSLGNVSSAQNGANKEEPVEPLNQVDENGLKQGVWVYFGKDQPEKGYPMDGKISEGGFLDDRKDGVWIIYFKDGVTPRTQGTFKNNRPNGPFIKYHQNGQIKEQGTFSQKKYVDSLARFNAEGTKTYQASFNESGNEDGTVTYYHDNGQPELIYTANNGKPNGKATRYWPNGDVKEEIVYAEDGSIAETSGVIEMTSPVVEISDIDKDAKDAPKFKGEGDFEPNGYNKVFNDDKELWMDGDFKNGQLWNGRLYVYDEDGLLLKVEAYKKGKYHSDGQL